MQRPQAYLLLIISGVLALGTACIWYFGSPAKAELKLSKGEEASMWMLRLVPQRGDFFLLFKRDYPKPRPELGRLEGVYVLKDGLRNVGQVGPTVHLEIATEGKKVVFEALPAKAGDFEYWVMELIPYVPHSDPARVPWPPNQEASPIMGAGIVKVSVKVLEARGIEGETVQFGTVAPLNRRNLQPAYEPFLWFSFWQLNLLVAFLCVLKAIGILRRKASVKTI